MKWFQLLIITLSLTLWSCETLKNEDADKKDDKPTSLADIDTSDLPEKYVPGIRPAVVYYVDNMKNSQFTFEDAVGDYRVRLFADNTFSFTATAKDKSKSSTKGGLWIWHRVGPDQGFLMLDNRRWFLGFIGLEEAKATTQGDDRSHMLKFSHM